MVKGVVFNLFTSHCSAFRTSALCESFNTLPAVWKLHEYEIYSCTDKLWCCGVDVQQNLKRRVSPVNQTSYFLKALHSSRCNICFVPSVWCCRDLFFVTVNIRQQRSQFQNTILKNISWSSRLMHLCARGQTAAAATKREWWAHSVHHQINYGVASMLMLACVNPSPLGLREKFTFLQACYFRWNWIFFFFFFFFFQFWKMPKP